MEHEINVARHVDVFSYVVFHKAKPIVPEQMLYVGKVPGDEVVKADNAMVFPDQRVAQV